MRRNDGQRRSERYAPSFGKRISPWTVAALIAVLLSSGAVGCRSLNKTQKGAVIGAGSGAVVGGAIGRAKGNTKAGAVIGGAVGGAIGAVIGRQMDRQAEELDRELEDATVERVGDGIQITFDSAILFDFDSSALQAPSRRDLDDLAASLIDYPNTVVRIYGHTDAVGSEAYNQRLSERRAGAVRAALVAGRVDPGRLAAIGLGESSPVASNATPEGRQLNRRVELTIEVSEAYLRQLEQEAAGG